MKFVKIAALGMAAMALAACSTVDNLRAVGEKRETPRTAAVLVAQDLTPALQDLALLCEAGILGDDTKALIARHGPKIVDVAEAYFESADACVVTDGTLQTDTSVAGACNRGTVRDASRVLPTELARTASEFGLDTDVGKGLFLASVIARRVAPTDDGVFLSGFEKDDTLTYQDYFDALEPLRQARDAVTLCVSQVSAPDLVIVQ